MKFKFISLVAFITVFSFFCGVKSLIAFSCTSTPGYGLVDGVCLPDPTHAKGPKGLSNDAAPINVIVKIISFILQFLAGLAVLMIIASGLMYMTSEADESRIDTAKRIFTTAVYGLILALLAYVIVYVISKALGAVS